MSLWAVKNDKGEWLYSDEYNDWVVQLSIASFYDTFEDADDDIECWELSNAYVVELAEEPEKIVVSEAEAKLWEKVYDGRVSLGAIASCYGQNHSLSVIKRGWTVAKTKRWNVKVPHTKNVWYYKASDAELLTICPADKKFRGKFTESEIEHYGLQDCEKEEVTDDEQ